MDEAKLRQLLLEYDQHHGNYPEHEFEGRAVFLFLKAKLNNTAYDEYDVDAAGPWIDDLRKKPAHIPAP